MPVNYIKSLSQKHNIPEKDLESVWNDAKKKAEEQGHKDEYDYITAIFKKMINGVFSIKESLFVVQKRIYFV